MPGRCLRCPAVKRFVWNAFSKDGKPAAEIEIVDVPQNAAQSTPETTTFTLIGAEGNGHIVK